MTTTYPSARTSPGPSLVRRGDVHPFPSVEKGDVHAFSLLTKEGVRGRFGQLNVSIPVNQGPQTHGTDVKEPVDR
jgi:hypothetical protein